MSSDGCRIPLTALCSTRVVDFGPGVDPGWAFAAQAAMNPDGKSPPFCSEF